MRYVFLPVWLFVFFVSSLKAQLKADFTMDKAGGCSPFSVSFTNTTTGASVAATYEWNFDNGNTSVFKHAGAVFHEEKTYTVKLTVKDGAQTSTQSKTITVYKKPTVAFTFSPNSGCVPLAVNFTSSSQPGDGTLAVYHWDFGDGSTQQSSGSVISHTYNFQPTAGVSLTVANSHGCSNTLTKNDIIKVHPAVQVDFTADKTILCDIPGTVNFSSTSTGPGTLTYEWQFGDGGTSKDKNPSYIYTKKGVYTVKLIVKSSEGCSNSAEKNNYINAGNFNSDIQVPPLICEGTNAVFTSSSSTPPNQTRWLVDGIDVYYWYTSLNYTFMKPGPHKVELINTFNGCEQKVSKDIQVKPTPKLTGFIAETKDLCGGPAKVEFKDTTAGAISWQWNFNYYGGSSVIHATTKEASYTYPSDNWYYASLTVKNADGCSANTIKQIAISKPQVGIFLDNNSRNEACGQLTIKMEARSTEDITSYSWNFGDGATYSTESPTHTYTRPGTYPITLTYKTKNGCTGTATYYGTIRVWEKPKADFTVQPDVCGNTPVLFTNKTTGYVLNYIWEFGDGGVGWEMNPTYKYQKEGQHTVRLIANNWICNDTIVKTAIIKVSPPFAKIEKAVNTCDGTRGLVTFTDGSTQANSWHWNFGDGATESYTTSKPTIEHTYAKTGSYKVVLSVTNGACTVKDSTTVYVLLKQKPVLSFDKSEVCVNLSSQFQIKGLENNPSPYNYYSYYYYSKWEHADGSQVNANYYNYDYWITDVKGQINFNQPKEDQVRAIIYSYYFNCQDTTNYVPLKINGVTPSFDVVTDNVCFKLPVVLKENSTTTGDNAITAWEWDFGDGTVKKSTTGGTISHIYTNPGSYYVNLKVTDNKGCSSVTPYYTGFVRVAGPKASFFISGGNTVQLNSNVFFYNTTNTAYAGNVTYKWDFGNGVTSTDYSPYYTYTEPGKYEVVLIAENQQTQCSDTTKQIITVKNFNTAFTFTTAFIGNYGTCPPVRANFTNTSTNYTKLVWNFGDGFTLEDQPYPSHVYERAGKYAVTLTVYGYNGLMGLYEDTVVVLGPTATIESNDLDGCIGTEIKLNAPTHTDTKSYVWDFGDGYVSNVADSFAVHTYMGAGSFTPSLIMEDDKGCSSVISLPDKVIIYPDPAITISPSSPFVCKGNAVQLSASGAETYEWSPEAGLSSVNGTSIMALPAETSTYTIKATDIHGCKGSTTTTVAVPKPFTINVSPEEAAICKGQSANLKAEGADSYQWINNTTGLNDIQIANPVASPVGNTEYTVVGYDQYKCYSDTANLNVIVRPSPSVNAGSDQDVIYGAPTVLNITHSNDVERWKWTPSEFLNCTTCSSPTSKPYRSMEYVVEVYNGYNCSAKDSVLIKGNCAEKSIYIPTAFTPNVDGLNDRFTIHGTGISIVKSLRIYNRWGEIVFEKKNFYPGDYNSAWNGRYRSIDAPAGAYVYFAEMECNAGESFTRKGTITLIR